MPARSPLLGPFIPHLRARPRAGAAQSRRCLFGLSIPFMLWLAVAPAPLRALGPLLGVPNSRLRWVYLQARTEGSPLKTQPHRVLAYDAVPGADPSILDHRVPEVRPAAQRSDLTPVFSFNLDGLWQGLGNHAVGDPMVRLPRWRQALVKARAEGFP